MSANTHNANDLHKLVIKLGSAKPGDEHAKLYDELRSACQSSPEAVIELACGGKLSVSEIMNLIRIGGHGGSVAKNDNRRLWYIYAELRRRRDELPGEIKSHLNWMLKTHGY